LEEKIEISGDALAASTQDYPPDVNDFQFFDSENLYSGTFDEHMQVASSSTPKASASIPDLPKKLPISVIEISKSYPWYRDMVRKARELPTQILTENEDAHPVLDETVQEATLEIKIATQNADSELPESILAMAQTYLKYSAFEKKAKKAFGRLSQKQLRQVWRQRKP